MKPTDWSANASSSTLDSVIIFDSDASNPYSEELVRIFRSHGLKVDFCGPGDHVLTTRRDSLRPRFQPQKWKMWPSEFFCLVHLGLSISINRPTIIVWARPYQKVLLSFFASFKRNSVFYIVHNPEPSRWAVGIRKRIEGLLLRVSRPVVHSEDLRENLLNFGDYAADVVVHPPYVAWQSRIGASHVRRDVKGRGLNIIVLGRMEKDKFRNLSDLTNALEKLPVPSTLRLLVRPKVRVVPSTSLLAIEDRSRNEWIEDSELAAGLRWADVLVAPYEAVTESGTVQLALTLGVRVVAFSGGALDRSLIPSALVEKGDYEALTQAILDVTQTCSSTAQWTSSSRASACLEGWLTAFGRRPQMPS